MTQTNSCAKTSESNGVKTTPALHSSYMYYPLTAQVCKGSVTVKLFELNVMKLAVKAQNFWSAFRVW